MKEFTFLQQESQNNCSFEEDNNDYNEKQYNDNNINVVVNKYTNSNKIEIILKHNDESLMQLLVEINKNGNDFDLSIFNNQPNKQQYEFNAQCDIKNDIIKSIVNDNEDEIKKFIEYILIDVLQLNFSYQTSVIERKHNIKIAECFDINSNIFENRNEIVEKIANAKIVIQEVQPSAQQPNIQERSGNIIQNISQWCLQNCCCCLNK